MILLVKSSMQIAGRASLRRAFGIAKPFARPARKGRGAQWPPRLLTAFGGGVTLGEVVVGWRLLLEWPHDPATATRRDASLASSAFGIAADRSTH